MKVSIVLPTYNEAENIVELVNACIANIPVGLGWEIVVVDDNSPDRTLEIAKDAFRDCAGITLVLRTEQRGLANSIRAGLEKSSGEVLVFMDTDFTHDPAEIPRMLHVLEQCDVVIGSRFCAGGSMEDLPHYFMSLFYNWFLRVILRTQIQDNLSGFLAVRKASLNQLPMKAIFFGYGDYCFRLLYYAQRTGMRLIEVPVQYKTRRKGNSKSAFGKLLLSYTYELLRLRFGRH